MRGRFLTFTGASPHPHLHLLQLGVVGTPEDHAPIAAPSGNQRPVPQGAEPKHAAIVSARHRLCDAVPTCGEARGRVSFPSTEPQKHLELSTLYPAIYPPLLLPTLPSTHLF